MFAPQTLVKSVAVSGVGLHTGAASTVTVSPAPAGRGRVFVCDGVNIPALAEWVTDTRRCTTLGRDGSTVATVEHLLAALMLAGVDDAEIVVEGPELPALDGAAQAWLMAIQAAGVRAQAGEAPLLRIPGPRWIQGDGAEFFLCPAEALTLYAALDVPDTIARQMMAGGCVDDPAVAEQIVRARTWGLEREVQALLAAGLARGGSLDNAVILTQDGYMNPQVWPNEPAWHKVLDLLGDLALVGARLAGQVLAVRAGHRHHVALACALRNENNFAGQGV